MTNNQKRKKKTSTISNISLYGESRHSHPLLRVSMAPGWNATQVIFANYGLNFKKTVIT
jgi:hypothetical protein